MASIRTNTVVEGSAAAGVTVDSVLLKDAQVSANTIAEKSAGVGVTVDGALFKDNVVYSKNSAGIYSAGTQNISTATTTEIAFDTELFDAHGSMVDIGNSSIVIPEDGIYFVHYRCGHTLGTTYWDIMIYVNGAQASLQTSVNRILTTHNNGGFGRIMPLAADDVITINVRQGSGSTGVMGVVDTPSYNPQLSVIWIGRYDP